MPHLFGGLNGALGRFYMGHISGKIATCFFERPSVAKKFDFSLDSDRTYVRRRFTINPSILGREKLLNIAFWPDNVPLYDASHRDPLLSSVYLVLNNQRIGGRLLPEAIRRAHTGPPGQPIAPHIRNVLLGSVCGIPRMSGMLRDRYFRYPRKPGFLAVNNSGKYSLHYHAEQEPSARSTIKLSKDVDKFGMRRALIDLVFSRNDVDSVVRAHEILDGWLRSSGNGRLEYCGSADELHGRVGEQASDGFHQAGTTRMAQCASDGVVDEDLRAFGTANLYVASSSVFRSSGQANSTLLAVALGVRLAHHVAQNVKEGAWSRCS